MMRSFTYASAPVATFTDLGEEYLTVRVESKFDEGQCIGRVPKEEAICEICCCLVEVDTSVLRTKCGGCKPSLVHTKCNLKYNKRKECEKCDVCELVIQHTAVTLSRVSEEEEENLKNHITSPKSLEIGFQGCLITNRVTAHVLANWSSFCKT
ncbi:hypothetical protein CASFOL_024059 [Castilleja foliolosa]|uniref:Uncharacterized protein n=1 Tax=Castilleja foliolosa TaxID=1961234 RepID=A0ABD3CQS4_9LAMI